MIISPHRAFAIGDGLARSDIVPAIRPMVNRVEQEALVPGFRREIWFVENRVRDSQSRLPVARPTRFVAFQSQVVSQAIQPLSGNNGRGTVHRLPLIERVRALGEIIAE